MTSKLYNHDDEDSSKHRRNSRKDYASNNEGDYTIIPSICKINVPKSMDWVPMIIVDDLN